MIHFLLYDDVIAMHHLLLVQFGGVAGIRSNELLLSALAQPEVSFGGRYLHEDIFAMAAAYGYHLIKNHPFIDGNKRTGIMAAIVFLERNGYNMAFPPGILFSITIGVAQSKISKKRLQQLFKKTVL